MSWTFGASLGVYNREDIYVVETDLINHNQWIRSISRVDKWFLSSLVTVLSLVEDSEPEHNDGHQIGR